VFPATADAVINIAAIPGVTAPVTGATPVTTITETAQYTGTVTWVPVHNPFQAATAYTATITLTAKTGFTLTGVAADFFTVASATATNAANLGVVTAVFPETASSDATLKASSTVKGQTVTSLGTPNATLGSETAGAVTITLTQAADTSNAGSFITLFDKTNAGATVNRVVKYATGGPTTGFETDTVYANEAITTLDFFIVKVTAADTTTILYYKVVVTATLGWG